MNSFMDFAKEMQKKCEQITNIITEEIEEKATMTVAESQANCPVKTGELRSSLTHSDVEKNSDTYSVKIGSAISYCKAVEEGHITTKGNFVQGRHMIGNSIEIYQRELDQSIKDRIESEVGR